MTRPGGERSGTTVRALVLGRSRLEVAGAPVEVTRAQRRLLARLAVTSGRTVAPAALYETLWDGDAPPTARAALQNQVSRLRARAGRHAIVTTADGYRLAIPTDLEELRATVTEAEATLADDAGRALALAERALALGTGTPLPDLAPATLAVEVRREVESLLDAAADHEAEAALALGLTRRALRAARRLAADAPYDEARALRLARALDQAGRRGEALTEIARVRRALRTELGLDGSAALDDVEAAIRGASRPAAGGAAPAGLGAALDAIDAGHAVAVSGASAAAVTTLLTAARDALLARRGEEVAMAEVRGYRDVAVAALLDLLDLLGLEPVPELGPVGTFVPAVVGLAEQRPVTLIVDGFDAAGPSTRRVLLEAARVDGVALVAGLRDPASPATLADFDVTITASEKEDGEARRAALRRRFAALPRAVRDTLTTVAVAGDGVHSAVLGDVDAAHGLAGALSRNLLRTAPDGAVSFVDDELRALVADDTPGGVRDELHHALGTVLDRRGAVEDAAHHLLAAADIEPAAAIRAARAAAAASTVAGAHHDAAAWLRRAADRCRDPRTGIAIAVELGDALRLAGDPSHVGVLRDAAEEAMRGDDDEMLGEAVFALLQLGGTTVSTSVDPVVDELVARTLPRLRDPRRIALVQGAASLAYSLTSRAERSRSLFLAAERGASDRATRRRVLPFAYMSLGTPGDLELRRRYTDELLTLAAEDDDPVARFEGLHLAASVHLQDGDGAAVRRTHREMTALVDRVGDVGRRWSLHYLAAAIAHIDGDDDRVEQLSSAAFAQFAPVSESRATAALFGQLFGLRLSRGRVDELRPVLETLVSEQPGVPAWSAALALSTVGADPPEALAIAARALDVAEPDLTWLAAQLVAARAVALAVRHGADDGGLLERCRRGLDPWSGLCCWQGTCTYGPVDTTLALLADAAGDTATARAHAAAARRRAESLDAPVFLEELRALGLADDDPPDAPSHDARTSRGARSQKTNPSRSTTGPR